MKHYWKEKTKLERIEEALDKYSVPACVTLAVITAIYGFRTEILAILNP